MRILPTCWLVLLSLTACGQFSSREHYVERGARFFEQGKLEDAALQFRKALQKDPNYGEAYYRLGLTDKKRGQERDAFAAF
ncbi:MAG: tetratricopeptide repeat protein, partial [Bryobacterales bacterium]|nr:tetratricopeptide repeat protein [Bryobacterales bacterium]